jgi:F-type H+-transporting ATPase subunit epsilon
LMSLVSPEALLFADQAQRVDLPGVEGDFGVLTGHAPIVALLRPGVLTVVTGDARERFVVLGGLAEFSNEQLTVLAAEAFAAQDFDPSEFEMRIDEMQQSLALKSTGDELDQAVVRLDHYKSIHEALTLAAAI